MSGAMEAYLERNWYCDWDHPAILEVAQDITAGLENDREKAVAIYYWVRDRILYRVGEWQKSASTTLALGEGTCTNKANLLIALCRSVGIPAGFGVMRVYGKQYFGPVLILRYFGSSSARYRLHIHAAVYIGEKWISVDPSDDVDFCRATSYFNPTGQLVDWDGEGGCDDSYR